MDDNASTPLQQLDENDDTPLRYDVNACPDPPGFSATGNGNGWESDHDDVGIPSIPRTPRSDLTVPNSPTIAIKAEPEIPVVKTEHDTSFLDVLFDDVDKMGGTATFDGIPSVFSKKEEINDMDLEPPQAVVKVEEPEGTESLEELEAIRRTREKELQELEDIHETEETHTKKKRKRKRKRDYYGNNISIDDNQKENNHTSRDSKRTSEEHQRDRKRTREEHQRRQSEDYPEDKKRQREEYPKDNRRQREDYLEDNKRQCEDHPTTNRRDREDYPRDKRRHHEDIHRYKIRHHEDNQRDKRKREDNQWDSRRDYEAKYSDNRGPREHSQRSSKRLSEEPERHSGRRSEEHQRDNERTREDNETEFRAHRDATIRVTASNGLPRIAVIKLEPRAAANADSDEEWIYVRDDERQIKVVNPDKLFQPEQGKAVAAAAVKPEPEPETLTKREKINLAIGRAKKVLELYKRKKTNAQEDEFLMVNTIHKVPKSNCFMTQEEFENPSPICNNQNVIYEFNSTPGTQIDLAKWGLETVPNSTRDLLRLLSYDVDHLKQARLKAQPSQRILKLKQEQLFNAPSEAEECDPASLLRTTSTQTDRRTHTESVGTQVNLQDQITGVYWHDPDFDMTLLTADQTNLTLNLQKITRTLPSPALAEKILIVLQSVLDIQREFYQRYGGN
ncbi:blast:Zinc finger CCCH domain-containing protein 13 [Drosophila guanche]|uniref:Blast:Zinc finger CCCH domain-containing protein 13 n=2 Tax=Drosophila guanche TaxID=7266 RepID=A0A3B0JQP1_DROGU|nr:blast:Zinc finger CCCH domain-containing protein 13 [Drosophila guanche]